MPGRQPHRHRDTAETILWAWLFVVAIAALIAALVFVFMTYL
jgi:phosphate/sulfate permease